MNSISMKNVGMAVALDVRERLALWALAKDYGQRNQKPYLDPYALKGLFHRSPGHTGLGNFESDVCALKGHLNSA
jgi:hypothetical protein